MCSLFCFCSSFILEIMFSLNIFQFSQKKFFSPPANFRLWCDPHAPCELFWWAKDFLRSILRCARDVIDHIRTLNCEPIVATVSANVLSSRSRHLCEAPEEARRHRHKSPRYAFLREHVTSVENNYHRFAELFRSTNSIFSNRKSYWNLRHSFFGFILLIFSAISFASDLIITRSSKQLRPSHSASDDSNSGYGLTMWNSKPVRMSMSV